MQWYILRSISDHNGVASVLPTSIAFPSCVGFPLPYLLPQPYIIWVALFDKLWQNRTLIGLLS